MPAAPHVAAQLIALGEGKADDELVFQSRNGRPVSLNQIATQLRRALEGTEWAGKVSPHAFRASIGTWAATKLGDEKAREFLRHTSVETPRKHYLRRDAPLVDPAISQAIAAGLLLSTEAEAWAEAEAANRVVRAPDPEGLGGFHARSATDKADAGSNDPVWDDDMETF
ncbi:tyrosine-type recombinase/integrase [Microbacterium sp. BG28]|uniref:tyrosine-type recombinase/integrase n=1 Tax=Microbacterium sp. BG28 TaxID=3097356 RepID=UPI002A5A943B|nr:tyrosine-type recombinase/integrase [Microbacterium sp. BG28]MDY0829639.1 tyrosine-type recombinase/integrase [Microbacterium sp. BG28]